PVNSVVHALGPVSAMAPQFVPEPHLRRHRQALGPCIAAAVREDQVRQVVPAAVRAGEQVLDREVVAERVTAIEAGVAVALEQGAHDDRAHADGTPVLRRTGAPPRARAPRADRLLGIAGACAHAPGRVPVDDGDDAARAEPKQLVAVRGYQDLGPVLREPLPEPVDVARGHRATTSSTPGHRTASIGGNLRWARYALKLCTHAACMSAWMS